MTKSSTLPSTVHSTDRSLQKLGWNEVFAARLAAMPNIQDNGTSSVGRVLSVGRKSFLVSNGRTEWLCTVAGKMLRGADHLHPVTGDWVLVDNTVITDVIPRNNTLARGEAGSHKRRSGRPCREQAIAANLDAVFIVSGLDQDFNVRRIERALTLVYNCHLTPVIVLTKADLHDDPERFRDEITKVAADVVVVLSSMHDDRGWSELATYLGSGRTIAMLGTSGAGKSTLANLLYGSEIQATGAVSEAVGKGRHTTTKREMILMPQGGLLMDSPGIREIAFSKEGEGVESTFSDILALAESCRFADCTHVHEPDCAVARAIETGKIPRDRLESYHKMKNEFESLAKHRKKRGGRKSTR